MKESSSLFLKIFLSGVLGLLISVNGAAQQKPDFPLKISENGHYLVDNDGKPFYFCGDTQWVLFWYYTYEDAVKIIDDRADKGFTSLLVSTISWGNRPNQYGIMPLSDRNTLQTNAAYYENAERIIDYAAKKNMAIYLVALWYGHARNANPDSYYDYGKWIGNRWKDRKNIIWVVGGDTPYSENEHINYTNLAKGIKAGGAKQIMSSHPHGGDLPGTGHSSSEFFQNEDWLDFYGIQAHCDNGTEMVDKVYEDYSKQPAKPTILIEQWYFWLDGQPIYNIHETAYEIRKYHYLTRLAGAFGEGYGAYPFWLGAKGWEAALNNQPVATQIATYMGNLLKPLAWQNLIPDYSNKVLVNQSGTVVNPVTAAYTNDKKLAVIYFPVQGKATINLGWFAGKVKSRWYDPTSGEFTDDKTYNNTGNSEFQSPRLNSANEQDHILIIQAED